MSSKEIIKSIENSDEGAFEAALSMDKKPTLKEGTFKSLQVGAMRIHTVDAGNTEWEACLFDGTTFDGINLQGAFFNGCTFHECHFINTILAEASFDGCVWQKSEIAAPQDMEAAELTNCQFKDCALTDMHFIDTSLESLSISAGMLKNIGGIAEVKSVVLRSVSVENFDTSEMTVSACTASGCDNVPKGFTACEGKRRRV